MLSLKNRWIKRFNGWSKSIPVLFYVINILLLFSLFLPNLRDLNLWDEAAYINSGRLLMEGQINQFASSPLISLLYGFIYLVVKSSPFWLLIADAIGRWVIFTLFFSGTYLVARELRAYFNPLIVLGLLTVMPLVTEMYNFPSDPLFAALSAFTFWQLLRYKNNRKLKHVWFASLFLGLAASARNDGLVLFPILLVVTLIFTIPDRRWWRAVMAAIVPFSIIVGGYILFAGLATGNFNPGILERTYTNFEAGHEIIFNDPGRTNATIESYLEARRVFGTPEENHYSVLSAIQRNPEVYLLRVKAIVASFPKTLNDAYGIKYTAVLLMLALGGFLHLTKLREGRLLAAMLLWVAPIAVGFVNTIIRVGYLRFPYFILYTLAGIGLQGILSSLHKRKAMLPWVVAGTTIAVLAWISGKTAVYYGASILLASILIAWFLDWRGFLRERTSGIVLLVFFCAGFVLHGNYPGPKAWKLGADGDEAAARYMSEALPEDYVILAGNPAAVWMSRHEYAGLNSADLPSFVDEADFSQWVNQNYDAIYIDHTISPYFLDLIEKKIGQGFTRVFSAENGDYQVLLTGKSK